MQVHGEVAFSTNQLLRLQWRDNLTLPQKSWPDTQAFKDIRVGRWGLILRTLSREGPSGHGNPEGTQMLQVFKYNYRFFNTGTPHFIILSPTVFCRYCIFYGLKVCGNPVLNKFIGTIFPIGSSDG